jgi:hypothetical protein
MSKSKAISPSTSPSRSFDRRRFLRGVGGVALALPALEAWQPRRAQAAAKKVYTVFMCEQNGTIQEKFYPTSMGPLTAASMMGTACEDLKDHAADLLVIKNMNWTHGNGVGCGHSSGCNTALTASKGVGKSNRSLPTRESADYTIGMGLKCEPMNLYAGYKDSYLGDSFAYGPGGKIRPADNSPWNVYQRMTGIDKMVVTDPGMAGTMMPPAIDDKKALRQKSLNDLLRTQIEDLRKRSDLSKGDRERLDLHFTSIRDLELTMTKPVTAVGGGAELVGQLMRLKDKPDANDLMEEAVRAHLSLIALAFATDQTQIATLQVGGGNSSARYMVNGVLAPSFHFVSHRVMSDGESGTPITNAIELHHGIDRIHSRFFKHLIEQLKAYKTADGRPLLEDCAAVWMNSLSNGPPHGTQNVPHVIAGSAGGFLKKGMVVDVAGQKNNKFLNTMITGAGVRKADGSPFDTFGDPDVTPGLMAEIMA